MDTILYVLYGVVGGIIFRDELSQETIRPRERIKEFVRYFCLSMLWPVTAWFYD